MKSTKTKMTLVFSGDDVATVIRSGYADRAAANGTGLSYEMERGLLRDLFPCEAVERRMAPVYLGRSSVQDEFAALFRDAAAGVGLKAALGGLRPAVEAAAQQATGLAVDCSGDGSKHLGDCWGSVCNALESRLTEASSMGEGDVAYDLEADLKKARSLLDAARGGSIGPRARDFFDVCLWNWETLGDYTYTYRSLMGVVELSVDWPNDVREREGLRAALAETYLDAL